MELKSGYWRSIVSRILIILFLRIEMPFDGHGLLIKVIEFMIKKVYSRLLGSLQLFFPSCKWKEISSAAILKANRQYPEREV